MAYLLSLVVHGCFGISSCRKSGTANARFEKLRILWTQNPPTYVSGDSLSHYSKRCRILMVHWQVTGPKWQALWGALAPTGRKRAAATGIAGTNVSAFQLLQVSQTGNTEASCLPAAPLLGGSSGRFISGSLKAPGLLWAQVSRHSKGECWPSHLCASAQKLTCGAQTLLLPRVICTDLLLHLLFPNQESSQTQNPPKKVPPPWSLWTSAQKFGHNLELCHMALNTNWIKLRQFLLRVVSLPHHQPEQTADS